MAKQKKTGFGTYITTLAKSNSLMGLLRRKAMDRARSPMVEFSG